MLAAHSIPNQSETAKPNAAPASNDIKVCGQRSDLPSLQDVIEQVGFGPGQLLVALVAVGVMVADGADLLTISASSAVVAREWHMGPLARCSMVGLVCVGTMMGNFASGLFGDWYGRRPPTLVAYVGLGVFCMSSAVSANYFLLVCSRVLVGMSFGFGQPAVHALLSEISPACTRSLLIGISQMFFCLGEMYIGILIRIDDPSLIRLNWRRLLALGSLPAVLFGTLSFLFLPESPMYNCMVGKMSEAQKMLATLAKRNGKPDMPVAFREPEVRRERTKGAAVRKELHILFSGPLLLTTLITVQIVLFANLSYFGSLYAIPQVLTQVDASSPADDLVLGAAFELAGSIFATGLCVAMARLPAMKLTLGLQAFALAAFGFAGPRQNGTSLMRMIMYFGYYTLKFGTTTVYMVASQYAAEVYPTNARTSGVAVVLGSGKLAAIGAPFVYEIFAGHLGYGAFFYFMSSVCFVTFLLVHLLPFETFGKQLNDNVEALVNDDAGSSLGKQTASYGTVPRSCDSAA